jgi:hypothetical protein
MDLDLKTYLASLEDEEARRLFAEKCGTSLGHMRNVISSTGKEKEKRLHPATCVLAEKHSGGKLTRQALRRDWRDIWPELAGEKAAA